MSYRTNNYYSVNDYEALVLVFLFSTAKQKKGNIPIFTYLIIWSSDIYHIMLCCLTSFKLGLAF